MVNQSSKLNSNDSIIRNKELLSDLLDEQCSLSDLDDLLQESDHFNDWYRYTAVSAVLKNEYSAHASQSFCAEISAKIEQQPAIIATQSISNSNASKNSTDSAKILSFKRFTGGFAVAATVAFATFFSIQTIQVSDNLVPNTEQSIASDSSASTSSATESRADISVVSNELEQSQLEMLNDLYVQEVRRSDRGNFAPVSGKYVKTLRFSAEQWKAMVESAIKRQAELDAVKQSDPAQSNLETEQTQARQEPF